VVIGIAVVSAAAYFLNDLNAQINSHRSSMDNLREQAAALGATIAGVRAGQFGYVARGQNEDFWMSNVAGLMPGLEKQSAEFGAALTSPAAQQAFEPASAALDNLRALDSRVKEFVKGGTSLLAADMIFSDGLEATSTAMTQVTVALTEELRARHGGEASLHSGQMAVAAASAGAVILLMIGLALVEPVAKRVPEPEVAAAPPVVFETPLPRAKPAVTPKLVTTAQICGELARVADSDQLPTLMVRAARVLDAAGMIVWLAEPARQSLRPAISQGYEDKVVARMGRIHFDANNAVANAFRTTESRTVSGDASSNGAVIVPLMTSDGCVGVLSAEMRGGSEKDEGSQALASIFAAQLATLVITPDNPDASATFDDPEVSPLKAAVEDSLPDVPQPLQRRA
jgi:hypothetical protein